MLSDVFLLLTIILADCFHQYNGKNITDECCSKYGVTLVRLSLSPSAAIMFFFFIIFHFQCVEGNRNVLNNRNLEI